jgi:hypothetical protein
MAIHIISSPGPHGGVISGRLDPKIGKLPDEIAIFQKTTAGWSTRRLGVIAARLWSCDLGYRKGPRVEQWMAAVVSKGFDPNRAPREGDRVFQVTQAPASSLSVEFIVRSRGCHLGGHVSATKPPDPDSLFPFAWWHSPQADPNAQPGWMPFDLEPLVPSSARWTLPVHLGVQYAMLQVSAELVRLFDPAATSLLGTLPKDGVAATAITSTIEVVILTEPGDKMTGVVTGLRCAYNHVRELVDLEEPRDDERLQVVAWAIDSDDNTTLIEPVPCRSSGYWVFEKLPGAARSAIEFVVAVTSRQFVSSTALPEKGGEVIATTRFLRTVQPT